MMLWLSLVRPKHVGQMPLFETCALVVMMTHCGLRYDIAPLPAKTSCWKHLRRHVWSQTTPQGILARVPGHPLTTFLVFSGTHYHLVIVSIILLPPCWHGIQSRPLDISKIAPWDRTSTVRHYQPRWQNWPKFDFQAIGWAIVIDRPSVVPRNSL